MKDLYQIDRAYVLKGRLKGLAEEIRTARKQKRALLRYAKACQMTADLPSAQLAYQEAQRAVDGLPTPAQEREIAACKRALKAVQVPQHTQEKQQELRTLACHLGEIAPSLRARAALLAYMWLREKPYLLAEQTTREDNKAPAELIAIASFVGRAYGAVALAQRVVDIRAWLAVPAVKAADPVVASEQEMRAAA